MRKDKSFISYFQSVITIGIMSKGASDKEAAKKAKYKLLNKNGVNHCFFEQTPFELSEVESWEPDICSSPLEDGIAFKFNPSEDAKNVIATRLQKDVSDVTDEDYHQFVKEVIERELTPNDKR